MRKWLPVQKVKELQKYPERVVRRRRRNWSSVMERWICSMKKENSWIMRKWNMSLAQARELQSTGMTMVAGPAPAWIAVMAWKHQSCNWSGRSPSNKLGQISKREWIMLVIVAKALPFRPSKKQQNQALQRLKNVQYEYFIIMVLISFFRAFIGRMQKTDAWKCV